jgi:outer membrane protein W
VRTISALAAAAVLCTLTAAAEPLERFRGGVFGSDIGSIKIDNNVSGSAGGVGAELSYKLSRQVSVELAVAAEEHQITTTRFVPVGSNSATFAPVTFYESDRTYPVDVTAKYSFATESRWRPFAGFGFHHVSAPNTHPSGRQFEMPTQPTPFSPVRETVFADVNAAEVTAGVAFRLTSRVGLEGGLRQLLANPRAQDAFDPRTRVNLGLSFSF